MSDAELSFDTFILCDDIRIENTGKVILIGVYPTYIALPRYPLTFTFCMHVGGEVKKPGAVKAEFTIFDDQGGRLFVSDADSTGTNFEIGRFAINTNCMFTVNKSCDLHFRAKI